MDTSTTKDKLSRFGRTLALLLNRSLMYQKSHPIVKEAIVDVFKMSELLFHTIAPVVFILNREQFYVDEEQLDPRVNVKRIAHVFKTHGIQSVSFEPGLTTSEIDIFVEIFSSMTATTNAETVKKELLRRGAYNLRVNHVLYKKVTEDDQVVSREALKNVSPSMEQDDSESRKKFMDTLLESILTDEFTNTLNIKSLLDNPGQVSKNMIEADLASVEKIDEETPFDNQYGIGSGTGSGIGAGSGGGIGAGSGGGIGAGSGGGIGTGTGGSIGTGSGGGIGGGTGGGIGSGTGGGTGTGGGIGGGIGTGTGGGIGEGSGGGGIGKSTAGTPGGSGLPDSGTGEGTGNGGTGPAGDTGRPDSGMGEGTGGGGAGIGTAGSGGGTGLPGPGDGGASVDTPGTTTGTGASGSGMGGGPDGGTGTDAPATTGLTGLPGMGSSPGSGGGSAATPAMSEGVGFADGSPVSSAPHGDGGGTDGVGIPSTTGVPDSEVQSHGSAPAMGAGMAEDGTQHGHMLLHQLDLMQQEVRKHLEGGGDISLEALADAVFEMKKQLFEDIQTQKALGIAYANEEAILDNINELTDNVILQLIREEYKSGNITTQRFAQIILRLIPDAKELKRLLPKIKEALFECGMPPQGYLDLVDELKHVLENEELSRILEESSEAIGVDSTELIEELKGDSGQAAKLIYLASEIRKGGGDESALADILVDYVEQMTSQAAIDQENGGDDHLKSVISDVESTVLGQLAKLDVGQDVLLRMEERVNERMDSILDRMRVDWLQNQAAATRVEKAKPLTVLQTIEHNVGDDEEMADILKSIRAKVDKGEIEENDFSQIHSEIISRKERLEALAEGQETPEGVLSPNELMFILEKEIARSNRYNSPFSALAFSFVDAKPKMKALEALVTKEAIMRAALEKLLITIREVDYIGQIGQNKMVALLPMQSIAEAKLALGRVLNLLHKEPLQVKEVPVQLRVAGIAAEFDASQTPEAHIFAKKLSNQLMDMVSRIQNIRVLF